MEYRLKRHDGLWRWINDRGVPTFDAEHRFTGYIGSCMDVTEKVEGRKLIDLAHYDTLTSVFNRNYLEILIDFESQKSQKELYPLSVILIDVDNFKYFNDQYGHDFGDKVLSSVAALMSGKLRERLYRPIWRGRISDFAAAHPAGGGFRYCTADSGRVAHAQHRKFL